METTHLFAIGKCTVCAFVIFYGLQLAVHLCSAFMASPFAHVLTLLLATWIYMGDKTERPDPRPTEAVTDLPTAESVTTITKGSEQREQLVGSADNDLGSDNELRVSSSSDEDE